MKNSLPQFLPLVAPEVYLDVLYIYQCQSKSKQYEQNVTRLHIKISFYILQIFQIKICTESLLKDIW